MADFSLSGSTLTLTLTNTLGGIHSAGQLLTDVFFTLSVAGSPTLSGQTGDLVKVGAGGVVTDLGTASLGWGFGGITLNGENGFELCVICQGGVTATATPAEGILGPVSADGKYDNANASLTNAAHNPLVNDFATFTLTGLPQGVTITDVIFSFGTTPGGNVSVPEPTTLSLLGAGLLAVVALIPKKR